MTEITKAPSGDIKITPNGEIGGREVCGGKAVTRSASEIEQSIRIKTRNLQRIVVASACDIGLDLTELKATVPHGAWGETLKRLGYSSSTANNFMRLYQEYGAKEVSLFPGGNVQTFGNLDYSKALALLAVPADERERFAQEVDAQHLSVRKLREQIKAREAERDSALLAAEQARAEARTARAEAAQRQDELSRQDASLRDLRAQVQALECRPAEAAVQTVEAAPQQLAEAEARGKAQAEQAWRSRRSELEQANAKLQAELEAARQAAAPAQETRVLAELNVLFRQLQEVGGHMPSLLARVQEPAAGTLRRAISGVLRELAGQIEADG